MPRKGRETELVLKELESLSLKDQAEIKSPDFIQDVVTGQNREVDISIKFKVGTHDFLTVIECRDRKKPQDVTWIEQIITKTRNIQANKVIAVSTSGFTDGAKKLAEHENVVLRTLKEFSADETIDWFDGCIVKETNWNALNMVIRLVDVNLDDPSKKKFEKIETNDFDPLKRNVKVASSGEYVNFKDIINHVNNTNNNFLFNGVKDDEPPIIQKGTINFAPSNKHLMEIKDKTCYIDSIDIECECWIKSRVIPFKKALKYEENEKPLLDKLDYTFSTPDGKEVFFTIAKDHKSGRGSFKAQYTDSKDK